VVCSKSRPAFAADAGRIARFEREAKILASLNHPHIAAIYGVEGQALVMELVEGESPKGPMPFEGAWKIALQIADALKPSTSPWDLLTGSERTTRDSHEKAACDNPMLFGIRSRESASSQPPTPRRRHRIG